LERYIITGQRAQEEIAPLTKTERRTRAAAYKDQPPEEIKRLKLTFDQVRVEQPRVTRCRTIPLKLTARQHRMLFRCMRDARKTYNIALDYVLSQQLHRYQPDMNWSGLDSTLRSAFVNADSIARSKRRYYLLRTPKVIRQQAVKSLISHLKTFHTNYEKHLESRKLFPDARAFQRDLKFVPKFKPKKD
jgi:hypothetical protein